MRREKTRWKYYQKTFPWAAICLHRDGFKCTECGATENLVVHHIDESRKTGQLNNDLENLVTLCRKCHSERHGFTGNPARKKEVEELKESGMSFSEIGQKMGITRQRAHAIYHSRGKERLDNRINTVYN